MKACFAENGNHPQQCVYDGGDVESCLYAWRDGIKRDECPAWQPGRSIRICKEILGDQVWERLLMDA